MAGKTRQKTAVIVGAGVGGVATAARLAKAGVKVTVYEKNDFTGGRCSLLHHNGYVRLSSMIAVSYVDYVVNSASIKVLLFCYCPISSVKPSTTWTPPSKLRA